MFSQPVSPTPPGLATSTVSPSSSRTSRLRGLSILRNYTHNHLLSRDSSHHANAGNNNNSSSSGGSSPSTSQSGTRLTRSVSYSPGATTTTTTTTTTITTNANAAAAAAAAATTSPNRLTLVATSPDSSRTAPARAVAAASTSTSTSTPASPSAAQGSAPSSSSSSSSSSAAAAAAAAATADEQPSAMARSNDAGHAASADNQPSIRFSAYYDPRSTRPSLSFPPISRTLSTGTEVIRVGRYSERDSHALASAPGHQPAAAPVGFKSKVVSRRHCEFWYEDGKWYIKDVKSSSGTFLNHIRLSSPSQESKAFPVNDGDIVQLGIDFKGGEEMIFRCVKMRLELNRGWQNKPNTFNMAAHKRLRTMASNGGASVASSNSQDCSICLNSIAPCQSLFVAPCSHTWHFKCVRSLLTSPQYPIFICPNCRAGADLEADVEEPAEEWQNLDDFAVPEEPAPSRAAQASAQGTQPPLPSPSDEPAEATVQETDIMDVTVSFGATASPAASPTAPHATSEPLPIRSRASGAGRAIHLRDGGTPSPPGNGAEGVITPRNNAGPWVFDGRAGRQPAADAAAEMTGLDSAAEADITTHESSDDAASR
ncbi:hypothetical protein Trco_008268 [Trichoderma cornu-damae]|uniref:RING-type E3 ubiquitin transferase n=1 Tax=Trichoderma cornu-damae TaxID=654480 RepID=A0A9P8QIT0_9HYPO|nr:hypothetical protein Trco_008268 [Trichoderma cornu-damae]